MSTESRSRQWRVDQGTYTLEELQGTDMEDIVALLQGDLEAFYRVNEKNLEDCVLVNSRQHLIELFTQDVPFERERQRLAQEAAEVYDHEMEHKKVAQRFGARPVIYFRHQGEEKHDVFVYISNEQLQERFKGDLLKILKFYGNVMLGPSQRGIGNYALEERLANTLLQKAAQMETLPPEYYEPLTPGGDVD